MLLYSPQNGGSRLGRKVGTVVISLCDIDTKALHSTFRAFFGEGN